MSMETETPSAASTQAGSSRSPQTCSFPGSLKPAIVAAAGVCPRPQHGAGGDLACLGVEGCALTQ